MANLMRSAKSSGDWTLNDLESYHISFNQEQPHIFFDLEVSIAALAIAIRRLQPQPLFTSQVLPQPLVDQELLNILDADAMQEDCHAELVTLLDLAMTPNEGGTAVDDFAVGLSRLWAMFIEDEWHACRWSSPFLYAGKTDMQNPTSALSISLRLIFFSLCRRTRGWSK